MAFGADRGMIRVVLILVVATMIIALIGCSAAPDTIEIRRIGKMVSTSPWSYEFGSTIAKRTSYNGEKLDHLGVPLVVESDVGWDFLVSRSKDGRLCLVPLQYGHPQDMWLMNPDTSRQFLDALGNHLREVGAPRPWLGEGFDAKDHASRVRERK